MIKKTFDLMGINYCPTQSDADMLDMALGNLMTKYGNAALDAVIVQQSLEYYQLRHCGDINESLKVVRCSDYPALFGD